MSECVSLCSDHSQAPHGGACIPHRVREGQQGHRFSHEEVSRQQNDPAVLTPGKEPSGRLGSIAGMESQWRIQEFCSAGGGSTNSAEDIENGDLWAGAT